MMITLMLIMALAAIALLAVLPNIKQQILRDREEEMRHRGTAYMRAIQHFYKKFGRYPTKLEDLENTNNLRFLRKRYTDPMNVDRATGKEKEFKLLHQQDITLNNGPVLGQTPGQTGFSGQSGLTGQSPFGGAQSSFGGQAGGLGSFGAQAGGLQQTSTQAAANADSSNPTSGSSSNPDGTSNSSGSSSSGSSSSTPSGTSGSGLNGQTFGGGPILGVASLSKAKTIRVFYNKSHYNDWLFIYLPQGDRGGLLQGPVNPGMQTGNIGGFTPGQLPGSTPGQSGFGQNSFGQSGFGQSGLGQSSPSGGQNQGTPPQTQQTPQ